MGTKNHRDYSERVKAGVHTWRFVINLPAVPRDGASSRRNECHCSPECIGTYH